MKRILLWIIKIYQKTISYDHGILGKIYPNTRFCKFTPSCSEYAYTAVERYGVFKGSKLAIKRVIRCNPRTPAGQYDPVP